MELLRFMPGVTLVSVSRYRDTRPIGGPPGQGVFLNGACLLETELAPHDVLGMLAAVENTLDRERGERWGPRTVDLDLLLYDDVVLDTESLTLPHPRMVTRRFVLEPCVEIAPDLVHPLAACTLEDLLDSISSPHPHVAVVGVPGSGAAEVAAAIAHATLAGLVSAPPEYDALVGGTAVRPDVVSGDLVWRHAVEACAKPLLAKRWSQDPHGTVVDYWLATAMLEERIAMRERQSAGSALIGGRPRTSAGAATSIRHPGIAMCAAADAPVDRLLRLQQRIAAELRSPEINAADRPRAVVTIAAGDFAQAVQEAVAVVEAMV